MPRSVTVDPVCQDLDDRSRVVRRGPRGLGQVFGKHFAAQGYPYKVTVLVHKPGG